LNKNVAMYNDEMLPLRWAHDLTARKETVLVTYKARRRYNNYVLYWLLLLTNLHKSHLILVHCILCVYLYYKSVPMWFMDIYYILSTQYIGTKKKLECTR